jgi:lipopolysaccharide export system protein LptA
VLCALFVVAGSPVYAVAEKEKKNNDPIEITADSLEVFRQENRAVFTGDVEALQSDMRLHSDVMIVYYHEKEGESQEAASGVNSSIERIEAEGNVFLSTPEETAQGKKGQYDLDQRVVNLEDEVVLTKGKNVVKGDYFVYNLDTGHSKVWSDTQGEAVVSGEKESKKQRVRSVFVPKQDEESGSD